MCKDVMANGLYTSQLIPRVTVAIVTIIETMVFILEKKYYLEKT
jgi:hypothetical protein